jgi:hypothetical protein
MMDKICALWKKMFFSILFDLILFIINARRPHKTELASLLDLRSATGVDNAVVDGFGMDSIPFSLFLSFFDFLRLLDDLGDFSRKRASWKSSELRLLSWTSRTELRAPSVDDLGNLNISFSRSGSLADFDTPGDSKRLLGELSEGEAFMLGEAGEVGDVGVGELVVRVGVEGRVPDPVWIGTARLEDRDPLGDPEEGSRRGDLGECNGSGDWELEGGTGTVRLDERDCLPPVKAATAGDLGSGVRLIETPDINNVGDFGIPVSDSYSLELSVSNLGDLQIRIRNEEFGPVELELRGIGVVVVVTTVVVVMVFVLLTVSLIFCLDLGGVGISSFCSLLSSSVVPKIPHTSRSAFNESEVSSMEDCPP